MIDEARYNSNGRRICPVKPEAEQDLAQAEHLKAGGLGSSSKGSMPRK